MFTKVTLKLGVYDAPWKLAPQLKSRSLHNGGHLLSIAIIVHQEPRQHGQGKDSQDILSDNLITNTFLIKEFFSSSSFCFLFLFLLFHFLLFITFLFMIHVSVSYIRQGSCYVRQDPWVQGGAAAQACCLVRLPLVWLVGYNRQGSSLIGLFPTPVNILAYMYSSLCSH